MGYCSNKTGKLRRLNSHTFTTKYLSISEVISYRKYERDDRKATGENSSIRETVILDMEVRRTLHAEARYDESQ